MSRFQDPITAFRETCPDNLSPQQKKIAQYAKDHAERLTAAGYKSIADYLRHQEAEIAAGAKSPAATKQLAGPEQALAATAGAATCVDDLDRRILQRGIERSRSLYAAGYRDLEVYRRHLRRDIDAGIADAPGAMQAEQESPIHSSTQRTSADVAALIEAQKNDGPIPAGMSGIAGQLQQVFAGNEQDWNDFLDQIDPAGAGRAKALAAV